MPWLLILRSPSTWVAAVLLGLVVWGSLQTLRLQSCQDHLQAATDENVALRERIAAQNAAVTKLKADSDAKVADAAKRLQDAIRATQGAVGEAARLRAAATKARPTEKPQPNCQPSGADRAVMTVREGLK